jgi:hypothetical protein
MDAVILRRGSTFAARCFHDLNPQTELAIHGPLEVVIAAKLTEVSELRSSR